MSDRSFGPNWIVSYTNRAAKERKKLIKNIQILVDLLTLEIEKEGPLRKNWANFGPLRKGKDIPEDAYHCHLKKGHPTYVACWKIEDKKIKKVEIFYVGTHENAPY